MKVVLMGARKRSEAADEPLINTLIDQLISQYPNLKIISTGCDRGIGKLIKNKCLPLGEKHAKATFRFVEIAVRIYLLPGEEFTKSEFAELFSARNAYMDEVGEEFHLFIDGQEPRGMMADMYQRVRRRAAPHALYRPGEKLVKRPGPIGEVL